MRTKPLFFLLLVFVISLPALAQEEPADASDTTFWDFGFYVSPEYNYRMAAGSAENGTDAAFFDQLEQSRIGYTLGINFTRQLGKILYIQTGIYYQSKGYKTGALQDTVLDLYDQYLNSSEYFNIFRYNSLSIPVILKLKLFNAGKARFYLGLGLAPEFYLNKATLQVFGDRTERDVTSAEQVLDVKGLFNLGVYIPLSQRVSLALEPDFSYNILGFKDAVNQGIKRNPYTIGLGLQLNYKVTDQAFYDYYYKNIYKKPPRSNF